MNWKSTAISIACLMVGLLIGLLVGRLLPHSSPTPSQDETSQVIETRPARDGGRPTNPQDTPAAQDSAPPVEPSATATSATSATPQSAAMVTVPLELITRLSLASGPRKIDQDLFSGDGAVEAVLGISDHEKAVIQTAWRGSLRKIRDIEASAIQTEAIDEWSQRITLPELSPSMATLGSGFRTLVRTTLGHDRGDAFLAAKQIDQMIGQPTGQRAYTVTTEEVGDGTWRYRIQVEHGEQRRLWVGGNIPEEIRHLTERAGIAETLETQTE